MPIILILATYLWSSITDIILAFFIRKTKSFTPIQSQKLRKNYSQNSKNWWPLSSKTSTTPKNFKNKPIIKVISFKATSQLTKFGWIASSLKLSRIASWKPSFWHFSNVIPNKQISLQAQIAQVIEDLWYLLRIITRIQYFKKRISE